MNSIKKISILSFILIIISIVIINIFGSTYKVVFYGYKVNDELIIENDAVELVKKEIKKDNLEITLKGRKPGRVFINLKSSDEASSQYLLYVHNNLVITDNNYFGKSTCSEVIPISMSIILIYSLVLLYKKYKKIVKDNIFQYKNISYIGLIIFLSIFTINTFFSIFNYQGLYSSIEQIINSVQFTPFIILPVAFITFLLVSISNINLIIKEGISISNILGLLLGIFLCFSTFLPDLLYSLLMNYRFIDISNLNTIGPYLYNFIEALLYLVISYLECLLIGTIIIAIKSVNHKISYNKDYIIILGCQIRKDGSLTPLLRGRVDKAIEFRNKQLESTGKDLVFIPSGGKGNDEVISEAEAMRNYLVSKGIDKKNIIVEDKSTNTYENINNSCKLAKNANICFCTTNYHVLRAGLIATAQGLKLEGIGSKTKAYFWINAFIREYIGTLYSEKKKHIFVLLMIIISLIIMIGITYINNNLYR